MDIEPYLTQIVLHLTQAEAHLALLQQKTHEIERAGMYPAIPTERWKDDRYLYLYFPSGAPGLRLDSKQRRYIGADPTRIEKARRLAANRRVWEELNHAISRLDRWLSEHSRAIISEARQAGNWPRAEAELLDWTGLGTKSIDEPGASSPNNDFSPSPSQGEGPGERV